MRIVSLLPSATEILCALGLVKQIVGISHACDYPPAVCNLPRVTRSLVPERLSGRKVHQFVQQKAACGESLYSIDAQMLARLQPDMVVTQEQCSVCAVGRADTEEALKSLGCRPAVLALVASQFSQVFDDIVLLGQATGASAEAAKVVAGMHRRIGGVRRRLSGVRRPRVFCLSWFDPLMAASHWLTEMVWLAGGEDGLGAGDGRSVPLSPRVLRDYAPEVVLLMPCGLALRETVAEWRSRAMADIYAGIPAVTNGRVFAVEGSPFHRPSPRLVDAIEVVGGLLHPLRLRPRLPAALVTKVA